MERARAMQKTDSAPACFSMRDASESVEPVVITSSTSSGIPEHFFETKVPITFARRSSSESPPCRAGAPTRRKRSRHGLSRRFASADARYLHWLYPRSHLRTFTAGIGTTHDIFPSMNLAIAAASRKSTKSSRRYILPRNLNLLMSSLASPSNLSAATALSKCGLCIRQSSHRNSPSRPGASRPHFLHSPDDGLNGKRMRQSAQMCRDGRSDGREQISHVRGHAASFIISNSFSMP